MIVKILFVGENKDLGNAVREMLILNGYLVVEAADSEQALSLLASEVFNLILIDNEMPDGSNSEILRSIREKKIPGKVIILTGLPGLEDEVNLVVKEMTETTKDLQSTVHPAKPIEFALSAEYHTNLKLEIFKARDIIKSTPTGDLDMTASVQILSQIATAGERMVDFAVIIDLREVHSHLSMTDIYQLTADLFRYGRTFHRRTAVLTQGSKGLDQSVFFETTATNRGFNIKAFAQFEEAVYWLMSGDGHPEDHHK